MAVMDAETHAHKYLGTAITVALMMFAVWLVSPFIRINRSLYSQGAIVGYRLALGLTIMIIFIGKWVFDAYSPQGLARKVSDVKGILLLALSLVVLGFVIYVVAQAAALYLNTAAREQQQQQQIFNLP
jgi:hypothetical protein